jgi:hypothetical protein
MYAVGATLIVADIVYTLEQPVPVPLLTVTEYVPELAGVLPVTLAAAVAAPVIVAGPAHEYPVTFKGVFALSVKVPPWHTGLLFVTLPSDGAALTVADVVYTAVQPVPEPLFTVTLYTPVAVVGAETTLAVAVVPPVIVPGPAQLYPVTFAGVLAVRFNVVPAHIGPLFVALARVGAVLIVIEGVVTAELVHPEPG